MPRHLISEFTKAQLEAACRFILWTKQEALAGREPDLSQMVRVKVWAANDDERETWFEVRYRRPEAQERLRV